MADVVVNGVPHHVDAVAVQLIGWLRSTLGLTGTKPGCGEGQCGACTVLVDDEPVLSCQTSVGDVAGHAVTTVEGLAGGGWLHPAQQALVEEGASQCGYCTPAMAVRMAALLRGDLEPGTVAAALDPNLCRCGCHPRIRRAVHRAATLARADSGVPVTDGAPDATDLLRRPRRPWDLVPPEERDYEAVLGPGLVCVWPGGAWLHVAPSRRVTAFSGKVDVGQDNRTAFRLLVAEELGVDLERVEVVQGDTDVCPFDIGTFGSRSMPDSGEALRRAAAGARQVLADLDTLVDRCRLVVLDAEPPLVTPADRRLVGRWGHVPERVDAVTGRRRFVSDLERPGMGHGAVLRPSFPGARIRWVETAAAEALPGVTVVQDGTFVGVVADDPAAARRAVAAVDVEWEVLPPIEGDLATYLRAHPVAAAGWERPVDEQGGDVDAALASAHEKVRATYTTAYLAHVPLETRAALAEWEGDRLTVWTGTQVPFGVRRQVAEAVGVDEGDVRVVVPPTGGAFGGKHGADVALEAARLARAAGRPVRVHWSRAEELRWGTVRPMAVIDVVAGLDAHGDLAAWDFCDVNAGAAALAPPYRVGARRLRYQPARSPLRQGAYRALAASANNFARESAVDELAHLRGEDPLAFRLARLDDERLASVLQTAAERFRWATAGAERDGVRTGRGLAVGLEKGGRVATCAEVRVDPDGRVAVSRVVTAYDCGTIVNPDTVANQVEGATMMALGGTLLEAVPVEGGRLVEPSLTRYPLPRFADLPDIEVVLCDRPDLPSAGAGETPMIAVAPAVANALFAATGRRLRDLPLTPDRRLPDPD